MPTFEPGELGRLLIEEARRPLGSPALPEDDPRWIAVETLRWGADDLDDDALWAEVMAAVSTAKEESLFVYLSDGLIAESVRTRPGLYARWLNEAERNPKVRAIEDVELW